jgi:hypothetical protein
MKRSQLNMTGKEGPYFVNQSNKPKFLAYAMQRKKDDSLAQIYSYGGFDLQDEPLRSSVSFLDFDGVVVTAGVYETVDKRDWKPSITCLALADLDRREREFFTATQQDKPFIFLLPYLPKEIGCRKVDARYDLFRRVAENLGVEWGNMDRPFAAAESCIPEFKNYVSKHGTCYLYLRPESDSKDRFAAICASSRNCYGCVVSGRVFFLPCPIPQDHQQSLQIATTAIEAVVSYRRRVSREMPEWTAEFVFGKEAVLRMQTADLHKQVAKTEGQIDDYVSFKGTLCYQSDPLVEIVRKMLDHFYGVALTIDDKCIEDASLQDNQGATQAVVEIKGVKGNFTRANVNQVDSHRERLNLPSTIPGILIMNTLMGVDSLQEKDQAPHPDIIQKAAADHVLLIRTLDLLRYADGIEQGKLTKEAFRNTILTESGWLKVEGESATVEKG